MSLPSKVVRFDALRSVAFGGISGTYANLGIAFAHTMRLIKIVNTTDGLITISFDGGITDHDVVPAGGFVLYDMTTNQENNVGFFFQDGTQPALKGTVTLGTVYLIAIFGAGE